MTLNPNIAGEGILTKNPVIAGQALLYYPFIAGKVL